MYGYHVVAIFDSHSAAERAEAQLIRDGVDANNIDLTSADEDSYEHSNGGFFSWLFGDSGKRHDRAWYDTHLTPGRAALSVLVPDDHDHIWIAEHLVSAGALDLEDEADASVTAQSVRGRSKTSVSGVSRASTSIGNRRQADSDEIIPIVNEELAVGKRTTENRYRVRSHVVERPVEESIDLRDERVIVERRPVSGGRASMAASDWQDRDYEVIETHEEPVVQKRSRTVEEVVVRKDVSNRTEKVKDKVRETRVEVNGDETGARKLTAARK